MSRVRGLVLQRLGRRRAVLLTPGGEFVRVRLLGQQQVSPGQEVWGELEGDTAWETLRRALGGWQRVAAITALAFGAAGSLFVAVSSHGWLPWAASPAPSETPLIGEAVVDAQVAPAPLVEPAEPSAAPPPIRIVEHRGAPQLSVSVDWSRWPGLTVRPPDEPVAAGRLDLAEHLREALMAGHRAGADAQSFTETPFAGSERETGEGPTNAEPGRWQVQPAGPSDPADEDAVKPAGAAAHNGAGEEREGHAARRAASVILQSGGGSGGLREVFGAPNTTGGEGVPILRLRAEF